MKIRLLVVGKARDPEADRLHARYTERIERLGVPVETVRVRETRAGGRYSDDHVREREAGALFAGLDGKDTVIAVDPRGRELTSEALAAKLERWATPRATFVLGGPIGLHASVRERAKFVWSLSTLTFPHELALALVTEQIYRGLTLLRGVPYHK
jgi:23S rRNA (pseudouridine1915-N3)-methyltransferase